MAGSWLFECFATSSFDTVETSNTSDEGASTPVAREDQEDRGFRKKSREKMRRHEVNVKFDELIDLLGLSNRMRKSAILQEAILAIKAMKRDQDEMRSERDRLQLEVSQLASCLQYSHVGPGPMQPMPLVGPMHQHQMTHMELPDSYSPLPYAPNSSSFLVGPPELSLAPAMSPSNKSTTRPIAPKTMKPLRTTQAAHVLC